MGDKSNKALLRMLEVSGKNWMDLAEKLEKSATTHATTLTTINTKIDNLKPKSFWKTGSFWLAAAPYLIALILGVWALKNHQCITIADKSYGFCPK
jgi:hypothetical protein